MGLFEAVVLGLVSGVADFLPVGGSGHRILVGRVLFGSPYDRWFAGVSEISAALAALVAMRSDIRGLLRSLGRRGGEGRRVGGLLLAAVVPAALISLPFRDASVQVSNSLAEVGALLLVSGLLLYIAEELGRRTRSLESLGVPGALLVALLQVLAVLPGISRTGAAITGSMLVGITREAATRFALLLSIPLLVVVGFWDISYGESPADSDVVAAGMAAAFVGAFVAVGVIRWYVRAYSLMPFAYYLWAVGVLAMLYETMS